MKRALILILMISLFVICNLNAQVNFKENGEVFVLIGDGTQRGVYTLNNTIVGGQTQMLYTPQMYASDLKANGNGHLFTFTVDKDSNFVTIAGNIDVRINWQNGDAYWGAHMDTHAWHGGFATNLTDHYGHSNPGAGSSTIKPSGYIPYGWDTNNDGIPDAGAPACTTNWYSVPNNADYHSFIRAVGYTTNDSTAGGVDFEDNAAAWAVRSGWGTSSRNVCRSYYIIKEIQKKLDTKWTLWKWIDPTTGGSGNVTQGVKASSQEIKIERQYKNGCHDGCTGGVSGASIPAIAYDTHVAVNVYGTSYFYRSPKTSTSYEIKKGATAYNGSTANPTILGSPVIGNATNCKYFSVSTKGNNIDWIYCLNESIIRTWMVSEGFPGGASANVDEVVVSDQWWLDGGIVFALDKANGVVNMFERNENAPSGFSKITYSSQIPVGAGVDSLGSDGYGNLFFCKTTMAPSTQSGLIVNNPPAGHINPTYPLNWVQEANGEWQCDLQLLQEVRKEVFRYGYFSKTNRSEGNVVLGNNKYHVRISAGVGVLPNPVPSSWIKVSLVTQTQNISAVTPMEITAINYATPPEVNGYTHSQLDIDGPYIIDYTNPTLPVVSKVNSYYVDPNNAASYGLREKQLYIFMLENYPAPSIKDYKTNPIGDRALNTRSGDGRDSAAGLTDVSVNSIADKSWYNAPIQGTTLEMPVNIKWSNQATKTASKSYTGGFVSSLCYSYFDDPSTAGTNEGDRDSDSRMDSPKYKWYLYQKVDKYGNVYDVNGRGREICKMESDNAMFGILLEGGIYDLFVASDYSWFDYDNLTSTSTVLDRWVSSGPKPVLKRHVLARNKRAITGTNEYIPNDSWNYDTPLPGFTAYGGTRLNSGKGNWAHYRFYVVNVPPPPPTGVIVAVTDAVTPSNSAHTVSAGDYSMYYMDEDSVQLWELKDLTTDNKIVKMRAASPPTPGMTHRQLEWLPPYSLSVNLSLEKADGTGLVTYTSGKSYNTLGTLSNECFTLRTGLDDPSTIADESGLFSIPSEPGTYKMEMSATRLYHYFAKISTTIHDAVLDENITLVQEFEFPNYFECTGSTQVMIRDIDSGDANDTLLYRVECYNTDDGSTPGVGIDIASPEYFVTSGDQIVWHVAGTNFALIDSVSPSTLDTNKIYNPKVLKYYFVDDNPFGNEDPANYTSPSGSHGYLNKGNTSSTTNTRNPSFTGFRNSDYLFAHKHEQNYYARMTYEVFLPGLSNGMITTARYSDLKDFVGNLNSQLQTNSLLNSGFQSYTELFGGSGSAPTATRECQFLEKHFNTSSVLMYNMPQNDSRYPTMENNYFTGKTSTSADIVVTPDDIHPSVTPTKDKSYFSVSFNMKNLINKLNFSYEASAANADWVDTAPDTNRPHVPLNMKFFTSDNSGNRKEFPIATMRIRDNDSPNIFGTVDIPISDIAGITTVYLPSNIKERSYRQGYQLMPGAQPVFYNIFTKYNRGSWFFSDEVSAKIVLTNLSDSPFMSPDDYFPLIDPNLSVTLRSSIPIREDTRVKVSLAGKDNSRDENTLIYQASLNVGSTSYDWASTDLKNYKYVIFSDPGSGYNLSGWCADTAYSWEGPPNMAPNRRSFSFEIGPVYETKIHVHTIQNVIR